MSGRSPLTPEQPVTIILLGRPVPGNERKRTVNGIRFLPRRQSDALAALRVAASEAMNGQQMFLGPVSITMHAEMPIPESWSRKRREAALVHEILPTTKPDLKNLLWLAEDALSGVVFGDDKQVCEYGWVRKRYGLQPKLIITVSCIRKR